ncbi:hypothetical protein NQ315_015227 [Exocentrus adspersus]|uniref:Chorion peroxidase n=1 Tax=Exocentrus adspersus TaxID=1586481 RepID=A0AAV8VWF2_9CUCU|nr:hypothetical protein NQ315_015227 [Exocentrus adspersus]
MLLITLVSVASYEMNVRDDFDNSEIDPPIILTLSYLPIPDKNYSYRITDKSTWNKYLEAGKQAVKHKDLIEQTTPSLPVSSPSYRHQKAVATSTKATSLAYIGYIEEYATMNFHRTVNSTNRKEKICANSSVALDGLCAPNVVKCNYFSKYRSLNGSCNNLKHPETYGVSYTAFRRHLPPDYADGISKPRVSQNGTPLPSSRVVSLEIHPPLQITDSKFSVMLAIWGQFLDHDMTATASSRKANQETISCCNYNGVTHPECFPVLLESYDPFTKNNVTCIEFVRSAPAPTCCLGPREQLNQVSAFIDGSVIYGADEELTRKLRTFDNGMLKMLYTEDGRALLPVSDDLTDGCNRHDQQVHGRYCFLTVQAFKPISGDARANENLHLTSMHLLWARQHNLIALNLSKMNPHWTDEIIFQEARRIIGAQMQHITYNEFLPAILVVKQGQNQTTMRLCFPPDGQMPSRETKDRMT